MRCEIAACRGPLGLRLRSKRHVNGWAKLVLARKPGALRNSAPFKNWILSAGLERVRRKLSDAADGDRQRVNILTMVLSVGLPAVEAACLEALREGVHSADVTINIPTRRLESEASITISTPEPLRLQHAPAVDCTRYDSLGRVH